MKVDNASLSLAFSDPIISSGLQQFVDRAAVSLHVLAAASSQPSRSCSRMSSLCSGVRSVQWQGEKITF